MSIEELLAKLHGIENYEYNLGRILLIAIIATIAGSFAIGSFEVLYLSKALRKIPFGISLLIKSIFYLVCIFLFTTFATQISYSHIIDKSLFHDDVLSRVTIFLGSKKLWAETIYWGVMIMAAVFILQLSEKFGRGVLLNFLLGKYHRPKEEVRIFMFLDLTSSTAYAERLGHTKYSSLIKDCFYDLTEAAANCNAHIYQYVGDEVVLTWNRREGLKNNNCVKLFFQFQETIQRRSKYYIKQYGLVPEFKAGIHIGEVTIVEVGELKKELAYHGDPLNTTARIRSECNRYNKRIIISADLLSLLEEIDQYFSVDSIGVCQLKGKRNVIALFSVEEKL